MASFTSTRLRYFTEPYINRLKQSKAQRKKARANKVVAFYKEVSSVYSDITQGMKHFFCNS